jgi:hypothetical protein
MRLVSVLLGIGMVLLFSFAKIEKPVNPVDYVNPFIGTGGHGHNFPGPTAPFGMVQLSPDTRLDAWVFMPEYVELFVSDDGINFKSAGKTLNTIAQDKPGKIVKEFVINIPKTETRYIRVVGKNIGKCPPDHKAAGSTAWIFADEISVE